MCVVGGCPQGHTVVQTSQGPRQLRWVVDVVSKLRIRDRGATVVSLES